MLSNKRAAEGSVDKRRKFVEDLRRLREEALAELERQGYEVRGKTPAEIRAAIKRAPRRKANQGSACDDGVQDKRKKVA
jgi:hypothetical protein